MLTWPLLCRAFKEAILFADVGRFANLSRDDPALITSGDNSKNYFHLLRSGMTPMIFTSVIIVNQCHLVEPKVAGNGRMYKVIDGALMAGEFECFVGAIGMIIGEEEFKAQLYMDNLSFATAFSPSDSSEVPCSSARTTN
jgi:hypothetical protein